MTVKDLKEKIADLPDEMDVFMDERVTQDEYKWGLVNSAEVKTVPFEDPDDPTLEAGVDEVLILSEE